MAASRKVVIFIAMSLDGYIARPDGDIGFLSVVEQKGVDYGYSDFMKSVDTVIIGRKTYDHVIEMGYDYPHQDKDVYILSRSERPEVGLPKYFKGSLEGLVAELKAKEGKDILCDGGADVINAMLNENLIDEFIVSVIPLLLGDGIPLFKAGRPENQLELISSKQYEKGLVQLHYKKTQVINDELF
jgi:dihydrofolate reductase